MDAMGGLPASRLFLPALSDFTAACRTTGSVDLKYGKSCPAASPGSVSVPTGAWLSHGPKGALGGVSFRCGSPTRPNRLSDRADGGHRVRLDKRGYTDQCDPSR